MENNKKISTIELDRRLLLALGRGSARGAKFLIAHGAEMSRQTFCSPPTNAQGPLFLSRPARNRGLGWARQPLCPMLAAARARNAECCSLAWRLAGHAIQKQIFFYAIWVYARFDALGLLVAPIAEILASAHCLKISSEDARQEFEAALEKGQWCCAAALLSLVDPNARVSMARSPLFAAANYFADNLAPRTLARFLERCDASLLDDAGDSLVIVAARQGSASFLMELLSRGVGGSALSLSHDGLDILTLASANRNINRPAYAAIAEAMALAESREIFDVIPAAPAAPRRLAAL